MWYRRAAQALRCHRDEAEAKQEVEEDAGEEELDYLAPYLIQIDNPNDLTRDDAIKVNPPLPPPDIHT